MDEWSHDGKKLRLVEGNIALLQVEAVVNAANSSLVLGSGVAGAIRRFGGPSIQKECEKLAPIKVGQAVITSGGNLKAGYVIHAVGPIQGEGQEEEKLTEATRNSLKIARDRQIKSMAFPALSTGVFGFPLERCSEIMLQVTMDFLKANDFPNEVVFCLYGTEALSVFQGTLARLV